MEHHFDPFSDEHCGQGGWSLRHYTSLYGQHANFGVNRRKDEVTTAASVKLKGYSLTTMMYYLN